jgi:hypothetical protein
MATEEQILNKRRSELLYSLGILHRASLAQALEAAEGLAVTEDGVRIFLPASRRHAAEKFLGRANKRLIRQSAWETLISDVGDPTVPDSYELRVIFDDGTSLTEWDPEAGSTGQWVREADERDRELLQGIVGSALPETVTVDQLRASAEMETQADVFAAPQIGKPTIDDRPARKYAYNARGAVATAEEKGFIVELVTFRGELVVLLTGRGRGKDVMEMVEGDKIVEAIERGIARCSN